MFLTFNIGIFFNMVLAVSVPDLKFKIKLKYGQFSDHAYFKNYFS